VLHRQAQALVGKFATVIPGKLISGYRDIVRITSANIYPYPHHAEIGVEAIKPNGRTCEMMRHEIRVCRDQTAAAIRFNQKANQ
jgi:hypothetical protein